MEMQEDLVKNIWGMSVGVGILGHDANLMVENELQRWPYNSSEGRQRFVTLLEKRSSSHTRGDSSLSASPGD